LSQEWHLVIGQHYATCLICREQNPGLDVYSAELPTILWIQLASLRLLDWDRHVSCKAAELLERILTYRPELETKLSRHTTAMDFRRDKSGSLLIQLQGRSSLRQNQQIALRKASNNWFYNIDPDPFAQRLVTYLQASQYKLLKAYGSIAARKERALGEFDYCRDQARQPQDSPYIPRKFLGGSTRTRTGALSLLFALPCWGK